MTRRRVCMVIATLRVGPEGLLGSTGTATVAHVSPAGAVGGQVVGTGVGTGTGAVVVGAFVVGAMGDAASASATGDVDATTTAATVVVGADVGLLLDEQPAISASAVDAAK